MGAGGAGVPSCSEGTAGEAEACGGTTVAGSVVPAVGCKLPVGPLRGGKALPLMCGVCPVRAGCNSRASVEVVPVRGGGGPGGVGTTVQPG
jgi:hypothetical protein